MDKILIVDDNSTNIQLLGEVLSCEGYEIEYALNGQEAVDLVEEESFDLILMDVMMPIMDGYTACKEIKKIKNKSNIPIIFITANTNIEGIDEGFDSGGVDYILKPFRLKELLARVKTHTALKKSRDIIEEQNQNLEQKVIERTKEIALTQEVTMTSLATLAELRDKETGKHILRTERYIDLLARKLMNHPVFKDQLTESYVSLLSKSAVLHDVGKVGISDNVLLKPGKLTEEELEVMHTHTTLGRDALQHAEKLLGSNSFLQMAKEIAYTHHEKWDGTGYPEGIKGEEIPLSGRIMAIVDVYDSLIGSRVYKKAVSHKEAITMIKEGRGTHFCPDIVDAFLEMEDQFLAVAKELSDSPEARAAL